MLRMYVAHKTNIPMRIFRITIRGQRLVQGAPYGYVTYAVTFFSFISVPIIVAINKVDKPEADIVSTVDSRYLEVEGTL